MLKEIRINNFRNLLNVKINPSLITVLIGTNDSGKSGILHSLLVLKQSFHQDFRPYDFSYVGNLINLGSFLEVVHLHNSTNQVEIGITASFDSKITNGPVNKTLGEFSYTGFASSNKKSFSMDLSLGNLKGKVSSMDDGFKSEVTFDNDVVSFSALNQGDLGFNGQFSDDNLRPYNKFIGTDFVREYLEGSIFFVPVPRGIGEFKTELLKIKAPELMTSGGTAEITKNLLSTISYNVTLVDRISKFTEKLFGKKIRYQVIPSDLGDLRLGIGEDTDQTAGTVDFYNSSMRAYASNSGFGLNQIIFLFAQILDCPEDSTILIEEPEISLHPLAQRELMSILIEIAKTENKQLVFSTHSEHIVFALYDALDDGTLSDNELSIYSFRKGKDSAEISKVESIEGSLVEFLGKDPKLIKRYIEVLGKTSQYLESGTFSG